MFQNLHMIFFICEIINRKKETENQRLIGDSYQTPVMKSGHTLQRISHEIFLNFNFALDTLSHSSRFLKFNFFLNLNYVKFGNGIRLA